MTLVTHPRIIDVDARVPIRPITDNPSHVSLTPVGILIIPPFTRISHGPVAHHPRIDVKGQHELIRPACLLAFKPSQLIPAKRCPPGFNAGLAEHAVELIRTKTAGRGNGPSGDSPGALPAIYLPMLFPIIAVRHGSDK